MNQAGLLIEPIGHALHASVQVPGSKSLTNRGLLIAALADGSTCLNNALFSDDSRYFAGALSALGFEMSQDADGKTVTVKGQGGHIPADRANLFIGNAGTAARFLSAFLTLGKGEYLLDGNDRMRERPIGDLVFALEQLGARVTPASGGCPPVTIHADGLPGGETAVAGNISSQFLSALLMVAPYAKKPVEINVTTELNSKPYVGMTISIMRDFGVNIERDGYKRFKVTKGCYQARETYAIEPDASAASYFFAAPAILGGEVRVEHIQRDSVQGDIAFLSILEKMGCKVEDGSNHVKVSKQAGLTGVDVDMSDIPDTAQTLAVIAPFASSPTTIRGIASARVKETDRVSATCTELARLGVRVDEHEDGMTIYPASDIRPASIHTYKDHRMAMAFALIGLQVAGVRIEDPGCVSKTFPEYFSVLEGLR